MFFSLFLTQQEVLMGSSLPEVEAKLRADGPGLIQRAWMLWILVHCVTFGLVPDKYRVFWTATVNVGFGLVLSSTSNSSDGGDEPAQVQAEVAL